MTAFNVRTTIEPERLSLTSPIVVLGSKAGIKSRLVAFKKCEVEQTLVYHFLAPDGEDELGIANQEYLPENQRFIPRVGSSYRYRGITRHGIIAREIDLSFVETMKSGYDYWTAAVLYARETPEFDPTTEEPPAPSPADPFTISTGTRYLSKVADKDRRGNSVLNSAKQPFDPPIEIQVPMKTFAITRTEYRNPLAKKDQYIHKVNSDTLWGKFEPWTAYLENINVTENRLFDGSIRSWQVVYEIVVKDDDRYGWKTAILDAGLRAMIKKPGTTEGEEILAAVLDDDNYPVQSPAMLDGHGRKNPNDSPPVYEWQDGSPFEFFGTETFSGLALPNPYA